MSKKSVRHILIILALLSFFLIVVGMYLFLTGLFSDTVRYPSGVIGILMRWVCAPSLVISGICLLLYVLRRGRKILRQERRRAELRSKAGKENGCDTGFYITAVGGGTGLSTILRGLKEISAHVNAVVTVTDDGGSSGRLLEGNTTVPPGDIRNCLVALSPRESIMKDLFSYRFDSPEELRGHSLGNLMIAGLADITGDTAKAVRDFGRILNIRGNVIPVTLDDITLGAVMDDGSEVFGETAIVHDPRRIKEIFLSPRNSYVNSDAVDAILMADVVLLGPGSLYTSIIPNLLVPGIVDALVRTKAPVWYVANIMTQKGETEGYNLSDHIEAIAGLSPQPFLEGVIVNTKKVSAASKCGAPCQVENDMEAVKKYNLRVVGLPLAKEADFIKHDASVLTDFIASGRF